MSKLYVLCADHIPGFKIRFRLLRTGAEWQAQRIVEHLNKDAILSMSLTADQLERIVKVVEDESDFFM